MTMRRIKLKAFGRPLIIERRGGHWAVFVAGNEGKRRPAPDVFIPDGISENEIVVFLDDLLHEWATPKNPGIVVTEPFSDVDA